MKPKLSFADLLNRFISKGITFGTYTEEQIEEYLKSRSYYYKISSYRKNYPKLPNGKYDTLTFNHLEATAKVDVRLREYLLYLCLDIEHATKTRLMTALTLDEDQDGYTIVEEFQDSDEDRFNSILNHFRYSSYKKDMFRKRTEISVWVLMEIIDYGTLVSFLEFCKDKIKNPGLNLYENQHKFVKNIRNACAHNDVYLINIFSSLDRIPRPQAATKTYCRTLDINQAFAHFIKIGDLINLFYIHRQVCSNELNKRRYDEGRQIIKYYIEHSDLLTKSTDIKKFFESIFIKCVDFLNT